MLYLGEEQITAQEAADIFGIDLVKLKKQPSFELDSSLLFKSRTIQDLKETNKGSAIRTSLWVRNPRDGKQVRFTYCTSAVPTDVGGRFKYKFEPRYITVEGQMFSFQEDLDKAVFLFVHPFNTASPIRKKGDTKKYGFIDTVARTLKKMDHLSNLEKALHHSRNVDAENLVLIAKGLGFSGVDAKEIDELRADVMGFAANPSTTGRYIDAIGSSLVRIEGRIWNLVDKGVIRLTQHGVVRQWVWASGERKEEPIGPQILSSAQDARTTLKSYILSNLDVYDDLLKNSNSILAAELKAKEYLEKKEEVEPENGLPDYLKNTGGSGGDLKDEIVDVDTAKAFYDKHGLKKIPANIKQFRERIATGEIVRENAVATARLIEEANKQQ